MIKVFFSFKYEDLFRAMIVRNSWVTQGEAAGFVDKENFEGIKRQGDDAIKKWINSELDETSVTVVLVGQKTFQSRWVNYEIQKSIDRENGLLNIDISKIGDSQKNTSERGGKIPNSYPFYLWNNDDGYNDNGYNNLGEWIGNVAKKAGR